MGCWQVPGPIAKKAYWFMVRVTAYLKGTMRVTSRNMGFKGYYSQKERHFEATVSEDY